MKFVEVERLPRNVRGGRKSRLKNILDEFMGMNVKFARYEFDEDAYEKVVYGYKSLYNAAKHYGYPVTVHISNNEIYFERRDI